jgi:hypothetical protein
LFYLKEFYFIFYYRVGEEGGREKRENIVKKGLGQHRQQQLGKK